VGIPTGGAVFYKLIKVFYTIMYTVPFMTKKLILDTVFSPKISLLKSLAGCLTRREDIKETFQAEIAF